MIFKKLDASTVDAYLDYLKNALNKTPDEIMAESFDEDGIRNRIADPFFQRTTSILAIENEKVIGEIEFHFYGCIQDGYKMAYVDWVYVLPSYRHRGIAQNLFKEFEKECAAMEINQYYLICSKEKEADKFYRSFSNADLTTETILRKYLSK